VRALITAGATRNPVDAMRVLTARASGRTGIALARALAERGLATHLLGSPEALLRAPDLDGEEYGSTRDLMARMEGWVRAFPAAAVVHSAAVGDYEAPPLATKIPSGRATLTLELTPAPKIADHVRAWGCTGPYVTFKAASPGTSTEDLAAIAFRQRERTGCDLVFANVLGRTGVDVLLVGEDVRAFARREGALAALVDWLAERLA
jgi:phosphopantothenoylcysteine synthetase/decarboxylase